MNVRRRQPHTVHFHLRRLVVESTSLRGGPQIESVLRGALASALSTASERPSREAAPAEVARIANAVSTAAWTHPEVSAVASRPADRTTR
jgi:hypothetical protein